MKALKFLGNRVEDAANAFIDVLKYSDQSVDYPESALKIALDSEIETIGHYKKIMNNVALHNDRADYDDVMYLLNKLVADEEHHIKLLKEAMGMDKATKGVTVIIK